MLTQIHFLEIEKSTLLYLITGVSYLLATPIAILLRTRQIIKRRVLIIIAFIIMGGGMIIRTGEFYGQVIIYWVYIGQILHGIAFAIL